MLVWCLGSGIASTQLAQGLKFRHRHHSRRQRTSVRAFGCDHHHLVELLMSDRIIKKRMIALTCDTVSLKVTEFSFRCLATRSVELIQIATPIKSFAIELEEFEPSFDPTREGVWLDEIHLPNFWRRVDPIASGHVRGLLITPLRLGGLHRRAPFALRSYPSSSWLDQRVVPSILKGFGNGGEDLAHLQTVCFCTL